MVPSPMLADQQNRNEIIDYDGHIFIVAGAGTGKSTIIADKILRLLETGKLGSIKRMAAITYTNKAAAELNWKIEEKLFNRINEKINEANSKETLSILRNSLKLIHESSIGTIHGFCVRLLRKYGYRENIDPLFSIISSEESNVMLEEAFALYFSNLEGQNREIKNTWKELLRLENYNSLESLLGDIQNIVEKAHLLENISPDDFPIKSRDDLENYQSQIFNEHVLRFREYLQYYNYSEEASINPDSLGGRLDTLNKILLHEDNPMQRIKFYNRDIQPELYRGSKNFISENSPFKNINNILKEYLLLFSNYPFAGKVSEKYSVKTEMREHFKSRIFPGYSGITNSTLTGEYTRFLYYKSIKDFHEFFMDFKRRKSVLSYNDIIHYAGKILQNNEILNQVREKYDYIFVDEYQDTDPVQTSIFTTLAGSLYTPAAAGESEAAKPSDNPEYSSLKLVRVGDAKQSIYSFRGADLDTFHNERNKFSLHNSGHIGHLQVNMRSHPRIINFINAIFTRTSEKTTPMDILNYEPIIAGTKKSRVSDPGVYINYFKNLNDTETGKIKAVRKIEAAWLASEIERLLQLDKNITICILFLSMKGNLEPYVSQLREKNIPFNLVGRRYYGENFTKQYLTLLLKFLWNHNDNISLMGFLRSPVAGFTDMEAEKIVESQYITNALGNIDAASPAENDNIEFSLKIERITTLIKTCSDLGRNQSLPVMMFYLFDNSLFYAFTDLLNNREIIRESMDRFLEIAVACENISFKTFHEKLRHFIHEIAKLENIPEVDESADACSFQNTVQIMSYHKSKGLEFDAVFMADLAYTRTNRVDKIILEPGRENSQSVLFQYKDDLSYNTVSGDDTDSLITGKKTQELIRLAYVAMTRAKERLYLPVHSPLKKGECLLNYISETLTEKLHVNFDEVIPVEGWSRVEFDRDLPDSDFFIQQYTAPAETIEDSRDEFHEPGLTIQKPLEIPSPGNRTPASYAFVSGTSIMKKLAAQKNNPYDKSYEKPSDHDLDERYFKDGDYSYENEGEPYITDQNDFTDAMTKGIIAHSVFELIDLKNPVIHENLLEALFFTHAFNRETQIRIEKFAHDLVEIYKNSELLTLIRSAKIIGKEIPFSKLFGKDENFPYYSEPKNRQKQIAVGYMDLVLKDAQNTIHIIDYKTNSKPDNMSLSDFWRHLLESYEIPMTLYKNAVNDVFADSEVKLTLYHTPTGQCFTYENR